MAIGRMDAEQHSEDWSQYIQPVQVRGGRAWGVWFDSVLVASPRTREEARTLMRELKADPALAAVALVQLS